MREMDTSEHHHHYPVVVHHHHHHYQARSDDQGGGRLIRRAPFPSAPSPKMETVDNHKPRSFDLTPLPLRRQAEHGPQSFDLIPLPHRGNAAPPASAMQEKVETVDDHGPQSFDLIPLPHRGNATPPMRARLPSSIAPAPWMRQGQGGASAGEYALTGPPGGRSLGVTGSSSMLGLAPVVMGVSQPLRSVGRRGGAV